MKNALYGRPETIAIALLVAGLLLFVHTGWTRAGRGPAQARALALAGTAFTYQGLLEDGDGPVNGSFDFRFTLFNDEAAGSQAGPAATLNDLAVQDGTFSAELDFGANAFAGGERWLQVEVRPGSSGGAYTKLAPRQKITPAPAALNLPNLYTDPELPFTGIGRGAQISSAEVFGIRADKAPGAYGGMYVETSQATGSPFYGYATNGSGKAWTTYSGASGEWALYNNGLKLRAPNTGGLFIVDSNSDGLRVLDAGDDGLQIGQDGFPNYGLYIPEPGVTYVGAWPNTSDPGGEWGLYTADKISASNVTAASFSLLTQVEGSDLLSIGDLVAVTGSTSPLPGSTVPTLLVRLADSETYSGVIGVVESRMILQEAPGKDGEGGLVLHRAEGEAQPGEYVSLVVYGVAEVKVEAGAAIQAGERLTASSSTGAARSLASRVIDGMVVTEGAPVIGIALESPVEGQGTIPVFVTLR